VMKSLGMDRKANAREKYGLCTGIPIKEYMNGQESKRNRKIWTVSLIPKSECTHSPPFKLYWVAVMRLCHLLVEIQIISLAHH